MIEELKNKKETVIVDKNIKIEDGGVGTDKVIVDKHINISDETKAYDTMKINVSIDKALYELQTGDYVYLDPDIMAGKTEEGIVSALFVQIEDHVNKLYFKYIYPYNDRKRTTVISDTDKKAFKFEFDSLKGHNSNNTKQCIDVNLVRFADNMILLKSPSKMLKYYVDHINKPNIKNIWKDFNSVK